MLLQDRAYMEELFASLSKPLAILYEDNEMNKAVKLVMTKRKLPV